MTLDELVSIVSDDIAYAIIESVTFGTPDRTLSILFNLKHSDIGERFRLSCSEVAHFNISEDSFECMTLDTNSPRFLTLTADQNTYVIWGDTIDWRAVIGAILQRFGHFPDIVDPRYLAETAKHQDYRLSVTLPAAEAEAFLGLLEELGVNHYLNHQSAAKIGLQMLWLNSNSYILAREFTICETEQ